MTLIFDKFETSLRSLNMSVTKWSNFIIIHQNYEVVKIGLERGGGGTWDVLKIIIFR